MKNLLVIIFGGFLSQGALAGWTCNIDCRVTSIAKANVSGQSTTYEDARSSMRAQCQGQGYGLVNSSCGKISNDTYECKGECQSTTVQSQYLSGSGQTQWDATNDAINNCRNLVQKLSPGTYTGYSVGPCGQ